MTHLSESGSPETSFIIPEVSVEGYFKITSTDVVSGVETVEYEGENAVHPRNFSLLIAKAIAGIPEQAIGELVLGNGGSVIAADSSITYNPLRVSDSNASLYNQTYEVSLTGASAVSVYQGSVGTSSVVMCNATIPASLPYNQLPSEDVPEASFSNDYAFDEIGLKTIDGKLLTHKVFSPILKTAQKEMKFVYAITITVS